MDDWRANYKKKKALLDELKDIEEGENSAEAINRIKNEWNAIFIKFHVIKSASILNLIRRSEADEAEQNERLRELDGNLSETQKPQTKSVRLKIRFPIWKKYPNWKIIWHF